MELWIRSQDKLDLIKCKSIHIEEIPSSKEVAILCYASGDKYSIVGDYETKERALEVLDEIQEYINNNCEFIEEKRHTIMGTYRDVIETSVFQMPKE